MDQDPNKEIAHKPKKRNKMPISYNPHEYGPSIGDSYYSDEYLTDWWERVKHLRWNPWDGYSEN